MMHCLTTPPLATSTPKPNSEMNNLQAILVGAHTARSTSHPSQRPRQSVTSSTSDDRTQRSAHARSIQGSRALQAVARPACAKPKAIKSTRVQVRSPAMDSNRVAAPTTSLCQFGYGKPDGWPCEEGLAVIKVGKRSFKVPSPDYIDNCPLASFQLAELGAEPQVSLRMLPHSGDRSMAAVFTHCCKEIQQLRHDFGCNLCVFKIGISANVAFRMEKYKAANFSEMRVIHNSASAEHAAVLEILLIQKFACVSGCRNIALGGDGTMSRDPWGPFFVYCVGARADRMLCIGA